MKVLVIIRIENAEVGYRAWLDGKLIASPKTIQVLRSKMEAVRLALEALEYEVRIEGVQI